jgi:hypothetical protein
MTAMSVCGIRRTRSIGVWRQAETSRSGRYSRRGRGKYVSVEQDKDGAAIYLIRIADQVDLTVSVCRGAKFGKIVIRLALAKRRRRTVSVG